MSELPVDALVVVSFGGPEGPDDVLPFMRNVTAGRNIPDERLVEVAAHYQRFGGVSPINGQNRALIAALESVLAADGPHLPVYFGNRNWSPYLADTVARMRDDGVRHALAFVTSAYSSYSGCRQYRDDIDRAVAAVEGAPAITKLRAFFNHPGFIEPMADRVRAAFAAAPPGSRLVCTAHSVPMAMADTSDYVPQLREVARLMAAAVGVPDVDLVYQSRSGAPGTPWLEPDVSDHLAALHEAGVPGVVLAPIGFISDHMEVVYDLDTQAAETADRLGLTMVRAATVGTDPRFVAMIRELVMEQTEHAPARSLGQLGPRPSSCAPGCCPAPPTRPTGGRPG